jgi:hypothetical protein
MSGSVRAQIITDPTATVPGMDLRLGGRHWAAMLVPLVVSSVAAGIALRFARDESNLWAATDGAFRMCVGTPAIRSADHQLWACIAVALTCAGIGLALMIASARPRTWLQIVVICLLVLDCLASLLAIPLAKWCGSPVPA